MKGIKTSILLFFIFSVSLFSEEIKKTTQDIKHVKYIFLMIGDGMGTMQRHCAEAYKKSKSGAQNAKLLMNTFPAKGFTSTLNVEKKITDSAAAGTALACGEKTENKLIGMGPIGKCKLKSIAYSAKERGMKVGIISNVPVDHATPAAFYATVPSRHMYYQIAMSIPKSKFDFIGGDGSLGENEAHNKMSPVKNAQEKGYIVIRKKKKLASLKNTNDQKILSLCKLKYQMDIKAKKDLTLTELTEAAIKSLDNPKGFFLMVEGGKIDWACHRNDSAGCITETIAFDNAVKAAYDFYLKHPENTLIVVTADHETGGMLQTEGGQEKFDSKIPEINLASIIDEQKMSIEKFYYCYVSKWKKNKISFDKALKEIKDILGLKDLTQEETAKIKKAFDILMTEKNKTNRPPELVKMYGSRNPVCIECSRIISERCGITWTRLKHTGAPVTTTAIGKDSEFFKGEYENTTLSDLIRAAIISTKK
jgi:alkaline phosphatase